MPFIQRKYALRGISDKDKVSTERFLPWTQNQRDWCKNQSGEQQTTHLQVITQIHFYSEYTLNKAGKDRGGEYKECVWAVIEHVKTSL